MKKLLSICLALVMVLALVPAGTLAGAFVGPTNNRYFAISTVQDLINFGLQLQQGNTIYQNAYVRLNNDIDMSGYTGAWNTGDFYGIFDGQGYTIKGLQSTDGGLFSALIRTDSTVPCVQNLMITDASFTTAGSYLGAVANRSSGVIKDCTLKNVTLSGACHGIGGIVGVVGGCGDYALDDYAPTTPLQGDYDVTSTTTALAGACVLNCVVGAGCAVRNTLQVLQDSGSNQVGCTGGIVGKTDGCAIENCRNDAPVYGIRPGGIAGMTQAGTIVRYCENYGAVTLPEDAKTWYVHEPSLDSPNPGTIETLTANSVVPVGQHPKNMGDVAADFHMGVSGIIGTALEGGTTVQNCMNYGSVCGLFNTGGLIGLDLDAKTMIVNCGNDYKFGDTDYNSSLSGVYHVGGLVGYLDAPEAEGISEHVHTYTADFQSTAAVIFNSYNAMPLRTKGYFKGSYNSGGVFGGLIGRTAGTDSKPSIENCHNASLPLCDDTSNVSFDHVGSFLGLNYDTKPHIIHCFGVVNVEGVSNVLTGQIDQIMPGYMNLDLMGTDYANLTDPGAGYYFDNSAYLLWQNALDRLGLNRTVECGGILIKILTPGTAPAVYDVQLNQGALTGSDRVIEELQTYVTHYIRTKADLAGRHFKLTADFLNWYCANQSHFMGGMLGCEEYAIFKSAGRMSAYTPLTITAADPNANWRAPEDPNSIHTDPNEPGTSLSHSLTLAGDIGLNYYVSIPNPTADDFMVFRYGETEITAPIDLNRYTVKDGVVLYKFSCPLNSSQISVPVDATVWVASYEGPEGGGTWEPIFGENFPGVFGKQLAPYSVNQYLEEISGLEAYQNNAPLMELMRSISVYGYYANELLGTDPDFVQSVLFDDSDLTSFTLDTLTPYKQSIEELASSPIAYYGSSLVLRSETAIRHYFSVDENQLQSEGRTLEDYTFLCEGPDGEFELTPAPNGSFYYVEIPNIPSAKLGETYTVRVFAPVADPDTDPLTAKWCYSGLSYAYKVLLTADQGGSVTQAQVQIAQALALYYKSAKNYFG